jgi:hypothetical protein
VGFAREWLLWTTEVSEFGCIDAGKTDVDLYSRETLAGTAPSEQHCGERRTVLSFKSFLFVGTFFHGNQPHPAILPPGVWKILKLSPSPTLVTFPKIERWRRKEGEMLGASGIRRRYRR